MTFDTACNTSSLYRCCQTRTKHKSTQQPETQGSHWYPEVHIFLIYCKRSKSEAVLQCSGSVKWLLSLSLLIEKNPVHKPLHYQTLIITALTLFKHWQTDWQTWCNAGVKYTSYIPVNILFWYKWLCLEYHYGCLAFGEKYQNFQHGPESGMWMQASFSRDKKYISNDPFYLLLQPSDPEYIQLAQNSHSQCSKSHKVLENDLG